MSKAVHSRRSILASAIALPAAGAALSACGTSQNSAGNTDQNQKTLLPAYVPYTGVKPDFPATDTGLEPGFLRYPAERPSIYSSAPGTGGTVEADGFISIVPPSVDKNIYWQEINKRLGVDLKFRMSTAADHPNRLATMIAGDDIPDFMAIRTDLGELPNTPQVLKAKFADLTEFLSGDAAKDYPSLANIPSRSWRSCLMNGGIYAIPTATSKFGGVTFVRKDIAEAKGLNYKVQSPDDYLELCKGLTDPKRNRWAVGAPLNHMFDIQSWFGCPNWWSQKDGKFTCIFETDNMRQALDFAVKMYKAGVFHPDAFAASSATAATWLRGGIISIYSNGATGYLTYIPDGRRVDPNFDLDIIPPFSADGGPGFLNVATGIFSITAIKKSSPDRVKELLRIADWLAAPFGTDEYTLRQFGIADRHFTWKDGQPISTTDSGPQTELKIPLSSISRPAPTMYYADSPERVTNLRQMGVEFFKNIREDASVGLYSDVKAKLWPTVNTNLNLAINDVIPGRKSLAEWDTEVAKYSTQIDAMRTDLEAAYEAANS